MPRAILEKECRRRLFELGCPSAQVRRMVREIAEHYEDLKLTAMEEGLSDTEADQRAEARIGEPNTLAEELAASLRRSSWLARHPFVGFCLLPPLGIIASFAAALAVFWVLFSFWLTPA